MRTYYYASIGLAVLCILIVLYAFKLFAAPGWKDTDFADIRTEKMHIRAEIAASPLKKNAGLSARPALAKDTGMLFIFSKPYRYPFWMKGMRIPLDFIWIKDGIVVDVTKNVLPPAQGGFPETILPSEPSNMVLEVHAGFTEEHGIAVGDALTIKKIE